MPSIKEYLSIRGIREDRQKSEPRQIGQRDTCKFSIRREDERQGLGSDLVRTAGRPFRRSHVTNAK